MGADGTCCRAARQVSTLLEAPHEYFNPNGDLPLTLTLHDLIPTRDTPPPKRGRIKFFAGRPTSIQPWQYAKETPPLIHYAAGAQSPAGT